MSLNACAEKVRTGDPDRFLSALTAAPEDRGALMVLYAFNLELARAPWVTQEPLIARMRLQFWRDVLDEIDTSAPARTHDVAAPLCDLVRRCHLPMAALRQMIAAREMEIDGEAHPDFLAYLDQTAGGLMWLAAHALGAQPAQEVHIRNHAVAAGLAAYFQALPALVSVNKSLLADRSPTALLALADDGLSRIDAAKGQVRGRATAALRSGWQARALLQQVKRDPMAVTEGRLALSEARRRGGLLIKSLSGTY